MFGVYISTEEAPSSEVQIGLYQRSARESDSKDCQVVCTSFDLPPVTWSPEAHVTFPSSSRKLVELMLLLQQRCNRTGFSFVSHEVLVKSVLPFLVEGRRP